jgi:hypothetical protein
MKMDKKRRKPMIQRRAFVLVTLTLFLLLPAISCTNLTAVQEWSKTSLEATQYNEIVTTYANTPQRLKKYDPSDVWDMQIQLRDKQAEALRQILSIISDYMAALATLSADSTIDYNKDVDAVTTSIGNLNAGISNETLGAVGSLVKAVVGAAAKAYQAKQVSIIIEQANDPLQKILGGELLKIIDIDFRRDLITEKTSLDRYYDEPLQKSNPSGAAIVALVEWKEYWIEQNEKRLKAVDAYVAVLKNVSEGHKKLYDRRNKLDEKELIKELYSLVVKIRKQIKILSES